MKILYIASLLSKDKVNEVFAKTGVNPGFAIMRFNRLLAEGFVHGGVGVKVLSSHPAGRASTCRSLNEYKNGVEYKYIPLVNIPLFKYLFQLVYNFVYVLMWGVCKRKGKAVVCDVLSLSSVMGAMFASKLTGLRIVGIVTDIPNHNWSGKKSKMGSINLWLIERMDGYVLLTEQMNEVVNLHKRPYIVMEGIAEKEDAPLAKSGKHTPRVIMYAGGLNSINGVPLLAKAVCELPFDDISLDIYGHGDNEEELIEMGKSDKRINYMGLKTGEEILKAEKTATILVNPRLLEGEYIKYSFPSKNMEYMQSGTPLLTSPLPCIPDEHKPYLFFFPADASIEGYREALAYVLNLPPQELSNKGMKAREYVLREKNNVVQAMRIVDLLGKLS